MTPTLNEGERAGVWIILFSKVTPYEDNVTTVLKFGPMKILSALMV